MRRDSGTTYIVIPCPWCRQPFYVTVNKRLSQLVAMRVIEQQSRQLLKLDVLCEIMDIPDHILQDGVTLAMFSVDE